VSTPGFAPKVISDVFLQVGQTLNLDTDVAVADVAEIVVTASKSKDKDSGPKTVLNSVQIATVVSVGRDPRDLARRDILVSQDVNGGRSGVNSGGVSIAGSNPRYNRIAVDGVAAQDNFGLAQGGLSTARGPVTLDAIEQFSVAAVPTDVQNGDFVGGAMNMVLKSGGNDFHGVVFNNYLNDGLVGKKSETVNITQKITQENYGGFLSGPLWRDHVFFAVAYETYATVDATQFGVAGSGAANAFNFGMTQDTIDSVVNTYNTKYASKFNLGNVAPTQPVTDKKYSAKLDWNITDQHRASLTYRRAESASSQRFDLGLSTAALSSHWYTKTDTDESTTFELQSHWNSNLSTFVKATKRDWMETQLPPSGQNYADVTVCTAPTSDATLTACATGFNSVRFGPDVNRHANALSEKEQRYQAQAEYTSGDHLLKVGGQARKGEPVDLYVRASKGQYYFDSLADFAAGKVSSLTYANAVTGVPTDAIYDAPYWTYSVYAQDTMRVNDDLTVAAGLRYDRYSESDKPIYNPNFKARNGFSNQKTIDGLSVLMPRLSAVWNVRPDLRISGGFGLFSGGTPDVLHGAPFYNNGFATSSITINRLTTGLFEEKTGVGGFTQAVGSAGLDNLLTDANFGYQIPTTIRQLQQGTLGGAVLINPLNEVIALAPNFKMPSQWRTFVKAQFQFGDGWQIDANVVNTQVKQDLTYYDLRAQPLVVNGVQQYLPDGRIRYDGLGAVPGKTSVNLGSNGDYIIGNTQKGSNYAVALSVSKSWQWGGDFALGYVRAHSEDMNAGTFFGTTAGGWYGSVPAGMDPNRDALGRSVNEIANRYKFEFGFHKKIFGDNETRLSLFAERQDGRPFGFLMSDRAANRSPVFGVNKTAQLLYVPDFAGDTNTADLNVGLVTFATAADLTNFKRAVDNFHLPNGALVSKYSNTNAPVSRLDMQVSQQLPTPFTGHKLKVQLDISNLLNLLNNNWGRVAEYSDNLTLTKVDCADASGVAIATTSAACPRYKYSNVLPTISKTQNTQASLWYMQVGLRYEF
jgi:TonB dependent receptor